MPAEERGQIGVAVLGMSRSGTSSVAGVFHASGFHLGRNQELMPADDRNPIGYHENLRVVAENEQILQSAGGTWFDPPADHELLLQASAPSAIRELVLKIRADAEGAPIAIKDPRIGVLLAVWEEVVPDLLHPVLVVRNPAEVAASLASRDGTAPPVAAAGWEVHMTRLLSRLRGRSVTIVAYPEVVAKPAAAEALVREIAQRLSPALAARLAPTAAREAARPELRRHRSSEAEYSECLTAFQAELWSFLGSLATGVCQLEVPERFCVASPVALAAVASETQRVRTLQDVEWLTEHYRERGDQLEACFAAHDQAVTERESLRAQLATAMADAARTSAELDAIVQSRSWRLIATFRNIRRRVLEGRHVS